MQSARPIGCAVLVLLIGLFLSNGVAIQARNQDGPKLEPGFRWVFDGKTLKGWHKNPMKIGHGTGGHWFVEDGAIIGE